MQALAARLTLGSKEFKNEPHTRPDDIQFWAATCQQLTLRVCARGCYPLQNLLPHAQMQGSNDICPGVCRRWGRQHEVAMHLVKHLLLCTGLRRPRR